MKIDGNQIKVGNILRNKFKTLESIENSTHSTRQGWRISAGRNEGNT